MAKREKHKLNPPSHPLMAICVPCLRTLGHKPPPGTILRLYSSIFQSSIPNSIAFLVVSYGRVSETSINFPLFINLIKLQMIRCWEELPIHSMKELQFKKQMTQNSQNSIWYKLKHKVLHLQSTFLLSINGICKN